MSTPTRQPKGIRTGGQFAAGTRAEPEQGLLARMADPFLSSVVNARHHDGEPFIDMGPVELAAVRDRLDRTGDFSYRSLRAAAEEAYLLERRYTPAEHERYVAERGDTSAWSADPDAVRRDIEQMRKDDVAGWAAAPHTQWA